MARKKELDKLSLDMIQCKKAGYGCHYGAWKATQDRPVVIKPKSDELPEGWRICEWCGKPYKPYSRRAQKYCELRCQQAASYERRDRARYAERYRTHMAKKRELERREQAERVNAWEENRKKVQYGQA